MIKVGVSEKNGLNFIHIIFKIFNIWHHVVDAWIILAGKQNAHIDKNDLAFIFNGGHIFTDTKFT